MGKILRLFHFLLFFVFSISLQVYSGTTGKIAGTITDKKTGDPLPGASIVIETTTLGAATDLEGNYTILHVPPGTYTLQITYLGYRKVTVTGVVVRIDQTTQVNMEIEEESIQLEELVITAEKKVIKPDVATSVVSITGAEVQALPITNVMGALGLQAGIRGGWDSFVNGAQQPSFVSSYTRGSVSVQGGYSIRGGGGETILFEVDGITLRDPRNNEPLTRIPLSAIKEVNVERGGFNAEYGEVQSGIVSVVTNEGPSSAYTGRFQFRYSPPAPKYWRGDGILDIHDPYSFALRPFFDPAVCWTGTENGAWDEYTKAQYPSFEGGWNEVARVKNTDNDPTNDVTPLAAQRIFMYETRKRQINDQPDFDIDAGLGGPVPFIGEALGNLRFFAAYKSTREMLLVPMSRPDYRDFDVLLRVNSDITPSMKLHFSAIHGKQFSMRNNWDANGLYFYPRSPSDIANIVGTMASTADLIRLFGDYDLSLADITNNSYAGKFTHTINSKTYYEVSMEYLSRSYDTRPAAARDTSALFEIVPGYFENANPLGYYPGEYARGLIIKGGQHVARARDFSNVSSAVVKADFTSQLNFQNLFKAGVEFVYNDLNFDYGTVASGGQTFSRDEDRYQNRVQLNIYPVRAGIYIQDKLELQEFTLNAGLRLDYSNSNTFWWDVALFNKDFFSSSYNPDEEVSKKKTEPQWQLSPRIGVAHPITERSKLFFNYGHFNQLPQYESMFRIERDITGAVTAFGNPNLVLAKTISYELGFDYLITDDILIQAAGFYNDISDQQDVVSVISRANGFSYIYSTSNNYQDTRGFELSLRKTSTGWWSGFINYTYLVNTSGHFGSSRRFDNFTEQRNWDNATVNSYLNRPFPQPYARANINLNTPRDFGPELLGHNILGNFGLNVVADWQAGYWTTWNPGGLANVGYNVKSIDYFNLYFRLDKQISFGQLDLQLFMDVSNALNTKRLWNTSDFSYMSSLHFPKSKDYSNIPGDDKVGDYREPDAEYQPMIYGVDLTQPGLERAWYFQESSGNYYEYKEGNWSVVDKGRVDKALEDKAYIDMPNSSTFWFLNPRRIFFGIKISFQLGR